MVDSSDADSFPREVSRLSAGRAEIRRRAAAARHYAEANFTQPGFAERFERTLLDVARR